MSLADNKEEFKIKLTSHQQFLSAWQNLLKLGYGSDVEVHSAPYLFCYADGHIGVEYMDVQGADLNDENSALSYFKNHRHKEISFDDLALKVEKLEKDEAYKKEIELGKKERPLFEANYTANGGDLSALKWDECSDGAGSYQVDWLKVQSSSDQMDELDEHDNNEALMDHASHVQSCLMSWIESAKVVRIPDGYKLEAIH